MTKNTTTTIKMQVHCDTEVKEVFKYYSHKKCTCKSRRKYACKVSGSFLNSYLKNNRSTNNDPILFRARKQYSICSNLKSMLDRKESNIPSFICPPATIDQTKKSSTTKKDAIVTPSTPLTRSQRLLMRTRIPVDDASLKGVKKINVRVGNDDVRTIDVHKIRKSQKDNFTEEVLETFFKVPFGRLTMRQRRIRMAKLAKIVFSACIDRLEFKKNSEEYMENNVDLCIDMMNLLDGMKEFISSKTRSNLNPSFKFKKRVERLRFNASESFRLVT